MSNPKTLKGFINYAKRIAPADKYDLILNDHGSGPGRGYGYDDHDTVNPDDTLSLAELKEAISESNVVANGGKFAFIDFDCCVMGNFETMLALSDCTDYFLGSADIDPFATVDYTAVFNYLATDPDMDAWELGKKVVGLFVDYYDEHPDQISVGAADLYCVVDVNKLKSAGVVGKLLEVAKQMRKEATEGTFYDEIRTPKDAYHFAFANLQDSATVMEQMGIGIYESDWSDPGLENAYTESALAIQNVSHNEDIVYSRHTKRSSETHVFFGRDDDGSIVARSAKEPKSGLSLFAYFNPSIGDVAGETASYIDAIRELAGVTQDPTERALLETYLQAVIDYELICNAGAAVSNLVESGCAPDEIDYAKVRAYLESQKSENNMKRGWEYISKAFEASDRDVETWLSGIIDIQKKEVLSHDKVSLATESIDGEGDFSDYMTVTDSSYLIPKFDGLWYAVRDAQGAMHLASDASENSVYATFYSGSTSLGTGELFFDGNGNASSVYIYGNSIPIDIGSLGETDTLTVVLCNDPTFGGNSTIDTFTLTKEAGARLVKDTCSNLGIEGVDVKLAISDMYEVRHEVKPHLAFDPAGGKWADGTGTVKEYDADLESDFAVIDAPTRDGYTFVCWKGSEYQPGDKFLADSDHVFTAEWKKNDDGGSGSSDDLGSGSSGKTSQTKATAGTAGAKTGDSTDPAPLLLLLLASGGALVFAARKLRREQ